MDQNLKSEKGRKEINKEKQCTYQEDRWGRFLREKGGKGKLKSCRDRKKGLKHVF